MQLTTYSSFCAGSASFCQHRLTQRSRTQSADVYSGCLSRNESWRQVLAAFQSVSQSRYRTFTNGTNECPLVEQEDLNRCSLALVSISAEQSTAPAWLAWSHPLKFHRAKCPPGTRRMETDWRAFDENHKRRHHPKTCHSAGGECGPLSDATKDDGMLRKWIRICQNQDLG